LAGNGKRRPKKVRPTPRGSTEDPQTQLSNSGDVDEHSPMAAALETYWITSRSGANSGRGYHYQDMVGAWVCLRMLSGAMGAERLLAEGLDDLTCEGSPALQIQVKSRQERVGHFTVGEVARFVLEGWKRRSGRVSSTDAEAFVLVLEQPIVAKSPSNWTHRLADDEEWELVAEIRELASSSGLNASDVQALLSKTTVVVVPLTVLRSRC
jgi:hypothetical protein